MNHYRVRDAWEPLNVDTPCGIFIRNDCNLTPFWVVRCALGKIAIQLATRCDRPAYSFIVLSRETALFGRHRGYAHFSPDERSDYGDSKLGHLVGTVQRIGWWISIRLVESSGRTWRCGIADTEKTFLGNPAIYTRWSLSVGHGEHRNRIDLCAASKPGPYGARILTQEPNNVIMLR